MKSGKKNIFSFIFLFVFLSAFSSGVFTSINYSLVHYSKTKEVKADSKKPSEDFVYEENETESETEIEFEHTAVLLPFIVSFLNYDHSFIPVAFAGPSSAKTCNPIYLSVCNFRI